MIVQVAARVRDVFAKLLAANDTNQQLEVNQRGELLVAAGLPELAELIRLGRSWQAYASTGVAALTALPTTTSSISLFNGETPGSNCVYLIESFGSSENVVDATQADPSALYAMNNKVSGQGITKPTAVAMTGPTSFSGRSAYDGKAVLATGLTVTNDGWFPHGAEAQAPLAPAVAGAIWKVNEAKVRGLYLVPPGGMFSTQVVKLAAAAAQQFPFVRWHEIVLPFKS